MKVILFILFLLSIAYAGNYYIIKANPTVRYEFEIEIGDEMLIYTEQKLNEFRPIKLSFNANPSLVIIDKYKRDAINIYKSLVSTNFIEILVKNQGYVIYQAADKSIHSSIMNLQHNQNIMTIVPKETRTTLIKSLDNVPRVNAASTYVQNLVNSISSSRLYNNIVDLAQINRYSLGNGIFTAQNWIVNQITNINPEISVSLQPFNVQGKTINNVIAKIQGKSNLDNWYIIGGKKTPFSRNTIL